MLTSQRAHFEMPRDVCYLNAAGWSPLPTSVQEAGRAAVGRKGQPWKLAASFAPEQNEHTRAVAARLINADPDCVALIPSVGYGVSTAGKVLTISAGSRVLVVADDHSSPVLEWMERAERQRFTVETVQRPLDGDWTAAIIAAVERPGAAPVALASFSSVHWSDGGAIDAARIAPVLRRAGGMLLVDATHGAGVNAIDVKALDPDVLIFPTYKWLLGPYGRAFMYIARRHHDGVPLEQTSLGRRSVKAEQNVYFLDLRYLPDARRYDMGERDHFVSMEMAAKGIEYVQSLGTAAIEQRLAYITGLIADGLADSPYAVPEKRIRAPQLICLGVPASAPSDLVARLTAENIHVAPRIGRIRISPHVYNDEEDVAKLIGALKRHAKG